MDVELKEGGCSVEVNPYQSLQKNLQNQNKQMFQTATASHNLGSAFTVRVEDAKDAFEKMVLSSYKETDMVTLYSDKVCPIPIDQLNITTEHMKLDTDSSPEFSKHFTPSSI